MQLTIIINVYFDFDTEQFMIQSFRHFFLRTGALPEFFFDDLVWAEPYQPTTKYHPSFKIAYEMDNISLSFQSTSIPRTFGDSLNLFIISCVGFCCC